MTSVGKGERSTPGLAAVFQLGALLVSGVLVQPAVAVLILGSGIALFFAFRPISRLSRRAAGALVRAKKDDVSGIAESVGMAQEIRMFDVGRSVVADRDADSELLELHRRSRFDGKVLPSLYRNSGSHRMSTLRVCDRLVVFDGGRISAAGPAHELLQTNPFLAAAGDLSRR